MPSERRTRAKAAVLDFENKEQIDTFMIQHSIEVNKLFKAKLLSHPEKAKLASYMISSGRFCPEIGVVADKLMKDSMQEIASLI
jgi:hypothetical protein